jgi:N-acetyl-alpha-D-glucosaminyl L-malate synthase BshA
MRIGLVCHAGLGGSGRTACRLAEELADRGHDVHLVARERPPWWPVHRTDLRFHATDAIAYPLFGGNLDGLAMTGRLAELIAAEDLELLHVHYAVPHAVSAGLARAMAQPRRPLPIIVTLHGTDVTVLGRQPAVASVLRFALMDCEALTAVSTDLARQAERTLGVAAPDVIPGFIDVEACRRRVVPPESRRRFASDAEPLLLHLSNFRPVKRSGDVVEVLARVAARRPCRLLLVGSGPDLPDCLERAQRLGVEDRVQALGFREDVVELLSMADVLLVPSALEAFGLAALEAMGCGLPVVASRVGGLPELLGEGVSGLLCPPGDVEAMAAATLSLLEDPALARRLGDGGRARAETLFAAPLIVERYLAQYRRLLS